MSQLHCCPICSIMPPPGVNWTNGVLRGAFAQPMIYRGRRSGKFWITLPTGCHHGPVSADSHATALDISVPWNEWAAKEAEAKADRFKWAADHRAAWLYHLGIGQMVVPKV